MRLIGESHIVCVNCVSWIVTSIIILLIMRLINNGVHSVELIRFKIVRSRIIYVHTCSSFHITIKCNNR